MGTTVESRINSTQAKDAIYTAYVALNNLGKTPEQLKTSFEQMLMVVVLTQVEYDALVTKDPSKVYLIKDV